MNTPEFHLAKIMSAKRAFAVSTGMSALDVITRLVKSGEEIIAGNDLYGGKVLLDSLDYMKKTSIMRYFFPLIINH